MLATTIISRIWRTFSPTAWAIAALLLIAGGSVATCHVMDAARRSANLEASLTKADNKALSRDRTAQDHASLERQSDTNNINARHQERTDAVSGYPDARPSPGRHARACVQLRQQGTRDNDLPIACRS